MTAKRTPSEKRRVSTSFDEGDLALVLHLLAALDLNDPERIKMLRQHPRSRALLERFQQMHAKATGRAPRNRSVGRTGSPKAQAIMADIRAARFGRSRMPYGHRAVLATRYGVSVHVVNDLVSLASRQDAELADAAE